MNKVITIHLHGRAYQLEEPGYNKLQNYLDEAKQRLEKDPDKEEILADLEQALGEKLDRFLNPHKTVILETEVDQVVAEMGPVEGSAQQSQNAPGGEPKSAGAPKRLYLISEGAMFRGVCTGLAAYFNIDVTLVRVIFVVLTILTHGAWIIIYLILMIVIPHASTSEQKAAAFGQPFTAQEYIDRARAEYNKFADKHEWQKWKQEFKQKMRQEKWERRAQKREHYYSHPISPLFGLLTAVLSILWIWGLVTLLGRGIVFGYAIPAAIPLWVALLIWLCLYGFVMWPLKAARYTAYSGSQNYWDDYYSHGAGFFETVVWLAFVVVLGWFVWRYVPSIHPYWDKLSPWWHHVAAKLH
jgi:phage shock protein PspC (stress-responsive transcriptional regulator)